MAVVLPHLCADEPVVHAVRRDRVARRRRQDGDRGRPDAVAVGGGRRQVLPVGGEAHECVVAGLPQPLVRCQVVDLAAGPALVVRRLGGGQVAGHVVDLDRVGRDAAGPAVGGDEAGRRALAGVVEVDRAPVALRRLAAAVADDRGRRHSRGLLVELEPAALPDGPYRAVGLGPGGGGAVGADDEPVDADMGHAGRRRAVDDVEHRGAVVGAHAQEHDAADADEALVVPAVHHLDARLVATLRLGRHGHVGRDSRGRARRAAGHRPGSVVTAGGRDEQRRGHDDGRCRGDRHGGGDPTGATDAPDALLDVEQAHVLALQAVDVVVDGARDAGGEVVVAHRSSSRRLWGARSRRAARARLVWDFTVPTETPSTSATSASDSSS